MTVTSAAPRTSGWVPDDSGFGARLALVRQRMAWGNVKEAAVACGLPPESWRTWERDNVKPRNIVDIAAVIADRTGCDYGWLLAGPRLEGRQPNLQSFTPDSPAKRPGPTGQPKRTTPDPSTRRPGGPRAAASRSILHTADPQPPTSGQPHEPGPAADTRRTGRVVAVIRAYTERTEDAPETDDDPTTLRETVEVGNG